MAKRNQNQVRLSFFFLLPLLVAAKLFISSASNWCRVCSPMSTNLNNEFKLKFDGELNQVDAATLGYSLVNITSIIQEVNQELKTGQPIEIKVKAHGEGSFLVHLALEALDIPQLLTPDNLKLAAAGVGLIITTVAGVFKVRKLLKGKPPKEITQRDNGVVIVASDNATVIVDKSTYAAYFGNPKVSEALSKTFKTLDGDPSVTGFEIISKDEQPLFESTREDFHGMALKGDLPLPETRSIIQPASLYIIKPSFERDLKRDVVLNGIKTSVAMRDDAFLDKIDSGERFAKGDVLEVELQIDQIYDHNVSTYLNRAYQINKVLAHAPRVEQDSLFRGLDELDDMAAT